MKPEVGRKRCHLYHLSLEGDLEPMSQSFHFCIVTVTMSSWRKHMRVDVVVAHKIHHGSCACGVFEGRRPVQVLCFGDVVQRSASFLVDEKLLVFQVHEGGLQQRRASTDTARCTLPWTSKVPRISACMPRQRVHRPSFRVLWRSRTKSQTTSLETPLGNPTAQGAMG